jgi:hypothetical protein
VPPAPPLPRAPRRRHGRRQGLAHAAHAGAADVDAGLRAGHLYRHGPGLRRAATAVPRGAVRRLRPRPARAAAWRQPAPRSRAALNPKPCACWDPPLSRIQRCDPVAGLCKVASCSGGAPGWAATWLRPFLGARGGQGPRQAVLRRSTPPPRACVRRRGLRQSDTGLGRRPPARGRVGGEGQAKSGDADPRTAALQRPLPGSANGAGCTPHQPQTIRNLITRLCPPINPPRTPLSGPPRPRGPIPE